MGLDVYLYRYENQELTAKKEEEYEAISEKNWDEAGEYDSLSEDAKEALRKKNEEAAIALGLHKDGDDKQNKERIEIVSKTDPEHYFKIGYFRSSYNSGGINRVLENLSVPTLYDIFNPNDEYCFRPDWPTALVKCNEAISALESKGNYACFKVGPNVFKKAECADEKTAMAIYAKELERTSSFGSYSNLSGEYFRDKPLKVLAMIHGQTEMIGLKSDCVYVIHEGENTYYINALKIVRETIEYVWSRPDPEKYFLHWSS